MNQELELLKTQFNNRIRVEEKRPGIRQLFVPLFHEDGDLVDIFIEESPYPNKLRISDHGMSLMRLSYSFEVDSDRKERIFQNILSEYGMSESGGNIFVDIDPNDLYPTVLRFAQAAAQVSSMRRYRREVVQSLFFESLEKTVSEKLQRFNPRRNYLPLAEQTDYEADYVFNDRPKPVFLFGVNSERTARLATISLLKFLNESLTFTGAVVLDSLDSLGKKDQSRLMSAADKLFPSLDDFEENGERFLERELDSTSGFGG